MSINVYGLALTGFLGVGCCLLVSCDKHAQPSAEQTTAATQLDGSLSLEKKQDVNTKAIQNKEVKPGANIVLLSDSTLNSQVNKVANDIIRLKIPRDKSWDLVMSADSEIELLSETHLQFPVVDSNSANGNLIEINLRWLARQAGHFYLKLHFNHLADDSAEARDLAIILEVGDKTSLASINQNSGAVPAQQKSVTSKSGEPQIIELPADESIKTKK